MYDLTVLIYALFAFARTFYTFVLRLVYMIHVLFVSGTTLLPQSE